MIYKGEPDYLQDLKKGVSYITSVDDGVRLICSCRECFSRAIMIFVFVSGFHAQQFFMCEKHWHSWANADFDEGLMV